METLNNLIIRNPRYDEAASLKYMWTVVFGDAGKSSFFRHMFTCDRAIVALNDGKIVAMGHLIPTGELVISNHTSLRCAMIYGLATLPDYRGMGIGKVLTNSLVAMADEISCPAVVLCPSDDSLFEFYSKHTGFREWFYALEREYFALPASLNSTTKFDYNEKYPKSSDSDVTPSEKSYITPALSSDIKLERLLSKDYMKMREGFLKDSTHIRQNEQSWKFQSALCAELGGGLFRIGSSCAVIERLPGDVVMVKELLIHDEGTHENNLRFLVSIIAGEFPAQKYIIRSIAPHGKGRRFGMLMLSDAADSKSKTMINQNYSPWYAMAFD